MSCVLTQGFTLDCGRDNTGGIKNIFVTELSNKLVLTTVAGLITAFTLASGKQFWKYQLVAETSDLIEDQDSDIKNGTVFWSQKVTATLFKMDTAKRNELKLVSQSPLMIIVQDSKDNYWLTGESFGMNLIKRAGQTGKSLGDLNGYLLNFEAKETDAMKIVTSSLMTTLEAPAA